VHGILFLSVAVSTIKRQCSREAAFFHVQEEPKLSGLDSDEIRFTGSLLLQTYTVGPHTLNGYINDLTCRAAIAHSAVYLGWIVTTHWIYGIYWQASLQRYTEPQCTTGDLHFVSSAPGHHSSPTALAGKIMQSVMSVRPFVSIPPFELTDRWHWFYVCTRMGRDHNILPEIESQGHRSRSKVNANCICATRVSNVVPRLAAVVVGFYCDVIGCELARRGCRGQRGGRGKFRM